MQAVSRKQTELYEQETYLIQKKIHLEQTLDEYELKIKQMSRQKLELTKDVNELMKVQ